MVIIEALDNDANENESSLNTSLQAANWSPPGSSVTSFCHQFGTNQGLNNPSKLVSVSQNNVFKSAAFINPTTPTLNGKYSLLEKNPESADNINNNSFRGREDSISEPLRCVFCSEITDHLRQMQCLHSICDLCIKGSPKGSDVCPVCQKPGRTDTEGSNHVRDVLAVLTDDINASDAPSSTPLVTGAKMRSSKMISLLTLAKKGLIPSL